MVQKKVIIYIEENVYDKKINALVNLIWLTLEKNPEINILQLYIEDMEGNLLGKQE